LEPNAGTLRPLDLKTARTLKRRTASAVMLPLCEGSMTHASMADLDPVTGAPTREKRKSFIKRVGTCDASVFKEDEPARPWILAAVLSVVLSVASVIPYNMILKAEPQSPLFINFCTHVFFVTINAHKVKDIICGRQLPWTFHVAFVILGLVFGALKAKAFVLLPTSLCMLLLNLQMLIAMVVERILIGTVYSFQQIAGCATVTAAVAFAGQAAKGQSSSGAASPHEFLVGTSAMLAALLALTLLSILVKAAFTKYGEAVDEQIFVQHACALPFFVLVPMQWEQIGPHLNAWASGGRGWLIFLLLFNMAVTFGHQRVNTQFAGRTPNLIIFNLVDTIKKFLGLVVTALLNTPPHLPLGFWMGSLMLVFGTFVFLSASESGPADPGTNGDDKED